MKRFFFLADLEFTVEPRLAWNSAILLRHLSAEPTGLSHCSLS